MMKREKGHDKRGGGKVMDMSRERMNSFKIFKFRNDIILEMILFKKIK